MTQISSFRASLIWVETIPSILAGKLPAGARYGFLGQADSYARLFDALKAGTPDPDGLSLPWSKKGNYFWKRYFEGKDALEMTGAQARKKFVPFRRTLPSKTLTADPAARVSFEVFYGLQGIAVVAKIEYRGKLLPALDVAKIALEARHNNRYAIDSNPGPAGGLKLDQAAEAALETARRQAFGEVEAFPGFHQPFSVASFIVGEVDDIATPVKEGSPEHRALEAVTSWNPYIDAVKLDTVPLAGAQLPMHQFLPSDMMYAHKTSRAIWLPRAFAQQASNPKISCYHRNIMMASLQALSLGEFVAWTAARHGTGDPIADALTTPAQRAGSILTLMASGKQTTYRTISVAEQIKRTDWVKDIALLG